MSRARRLSVPTNFVVLIAVLAIPLRAAGNEPPKAVNLSLDAASRPPEYDVNGGSIGREPIIEFLRGDERAADLFFSVDRLAIGFSGSAVYLEQSFPAKSAAADIFIRSQGRMPELFLSEERLGLAPGFLGDDIDGLQMRLEPGDDTINEPFNYNVIWRGSSMIGKPIQVAGGGPAGLLRSSDIIIGLGSTAYALTDDIGLHADDGIDALVLLDVTPDPEEPLGYRMEPDGILQPGLDMALFSLDPFSPTVNTGGGDNPEYTPATVFLTTFEGSFEVLIAPGELGLTVTDNIDALSLIPEPAAGLIALVGAAVVLRRRRGRAARTIAAAAALATLCGSASADELFKRRFCGNAPPQAASQGFLEIRGDGQNLFFSVSVTHPAPGINVDGDAGSIQLPEQQAAQVTFLPSAGTPNKIVFTHTVFAGGKNITFWGDVSITPFPDKPGGAVLDVSFDGGPAVRYLQTDITSYGFSVQLSSSPFQLACAKEVAPIQFMITPNGNPESNQLKGTWEIFGSDADLLFGPAIMGNWDFNGMMNPVTIDLGMSVDKVFMGTKTFTIHVKAETPEGCIIKPDTPPPAGGLSVPAAICSLNASDPKCPWEKHPQTPKDLYYEEGDTQTVRIEIVNPCMGDLTGMWKLEDASGGPAAYDLPKMEKFQIKGGKTFVKPVGIKNTGPSAGGPREFKLTVMPDQAQACPEAKVMVHFAPPKVIRLSSVYTHRHQNGQGTVHASYIRQVSVGETFEAEIDWRDHPPGKTLFMFGATTTMVPTPGTIASAPTQMSTLALGNPISVRAMSANGSMSMPFTPALTVVLPPVVALPAPLSPTGYFHLPEITTAPKKELKYQVPTIKFGLGNLLMFSSKVTPAAMSKVLAGTTANWSPSIEAKVAVSGSQHSASASFAPTVSGEKETKKSIAKALPKLFGFDPEKGLLLLGKLGIAFDIGLKFAASYRIKPGETSWKQVSGSFGLFGKFEGGIPPKAVQFTIPPGIPVYVQGKIGLDANVDVSVPVVGAPDNVQLSGLFGLTPKGGLKAGAGVDKVAAIEGALGLEFPLSFKAPPSPPKGILDNLSVVLKGTIKLVTFLFDYTLVSGSCSYTLYCASGSSCYSCNFGLGGLPPPTQKPIGRAYLVPDFAHFIGSSGASPGPQAVVENVIVLDEFPFAEPDISSGGTTRLLTWLTDDPNRLPVNRTVALFSRAEADSWSAPVPIEDDGTADFGPQIRALNADGDALAAWINSKAALPANATLDALLSSLEISTAEYNDSSMTWSPGATLTDNDYLDHRLRAAVDLDPSGTAVPSMLVWVANPSNHIVGTASQPNQIMYSTWTGSDWSAPAVAAADVPSISSLSAAAHAGQAVIAYCGDADGVIDVDSDAWDEELFVLTFDGVSWSAPQQITDDEVNDSSVTVVYDETGTPLFVWNRDGGIVSARQLDLSDLVGAVPQGFAAATSYLATAPDGRAALVWSAGFDTIGDVLYSYFDPAGGKWSPPGRLTHDEDIESYVAATLDGAGRLHASYIREKRSIAEELVSWEGEDFFIEVSKFEKADLVVASIEFGADLSVSADDIAFDPPVPQPGSMTMISATVENLGDKAADGVDVAFYDGDPRGGGTQIGSTQTLVGALAGGDSAQATTSWEVPQDGMPHVVFVVVDPDGDLDNVDLSNNQASRAAVGPDLLIDSLLAESTSSSCDRTVHLTVANAGTSAAAATTLTLRETDAMGALLALYVVDPLDPGEFSEFEFVWVAPPIGSDGLAHLYVAVDELGTIAETDEDNVRLGAFGLVGLDGADCNANGVNDACDIASGDSLDENGNGVPDECEVLYVDAAATGDGTGRSWAHAFTRLQDALSAAADSGGAVRQVWVAAGVYTPADPGGDRAASFALLGGVGVYGGFAGFETALSQRDLSANLTILSGDLDGNDAGGAGTDENSYHVVTASGVGADAVLDGLVVLGGNADGPSPHDSGGGIAIDNASPTVRNCSFVGCFAMSGGGAVAADNSDAAFVNCVFSGNAAAGDGAALHLFGGSVALTNCSLSANVALGSGGGVYTVFGDPSVSNCVLWGNVDGGGMNESAQIHVQSGAPALNYSCVQGLTGGLGGAGNIALDPLFTNPAGNDAQVGTADDDLRLGAGSPCVDAADNAALPADGDDLDGDADVLEPLPIDRSGKPRLVDDPATPNTGVGVAPLVDMGAYEFAPAGPVQRPKVKPLGAK